MMDFVFCTDANYLKGYGVLMVSILRFAPPCTERLRFHVIADDLDDADKALLQAIASRRENTEVAFYSPVKLLSKETIEHINATLDANKTHVTAATYYRILAADLLPPDAHRALYLDGDVICTGSLEELFSLDMKGCPVGMCLSEGASSIFIYNQLDYPPTDGYFTAGIIFFDLDLWRKENLTKAMFDCLAMNIQKLWWHDQDLINVCLHGRIFRLDFSCIINSVYFNVFYWIEGGGNNKYYGKETQFLPKAEWPALLAGVKAPRLVHFIGPIKPWFRECSNPFTPVWRYFCAMSPWKGERLASLSLKEKVKEIVRGLVARHHLFCRVPCPKEAYNIAQGVLDKLLEEDRGKS